MKSILLPLAGFAAVLPTAFAQTGTAYTNTVRQVQLPTGVEWDVTNVPNVGEQQSPLEINPGGARFELHTQLVNSPFTSYLLDQKYVGAYVPIGQIFIYSEDPHGPIPRTRADRPFFVDVTMSGLITSDDPGAAEAPEAAKSAKIFRHVQSYGEKGTGEGLDRTQATLLAQGSLTENNTWTLKYELNSVPGANRAKVRGEERFSIFSLEDYQAPESQLASQYIQIWPVTDGSISGITDGLKIRHNLPPLTLTLNDIYPGGTCYLQVYKGGPQANMQGTTVPGSAITNTGDTPMDKVLLVENYDAVFDSDGQWTMELLIVTPFGIERIGRGIGFGSGDDGSSDDGDGSVVTGGGEQITFEIDRSIRVNSGVTTVE